MEKINIKIQPTKLLWYNDLQSKGAYGCRVYENYDNKVKLNKYSSITLVGYMPQLELYKHYKVFVTEIVDPKYGLQYEFCGMNEQKPKTVEEQKLYLKAILTENQVDNICEIYDYPVDEIINQTFDFKKVKGLGDYTFKSVQKKILDNFALFDLLVEFGQYGITYNQIRKIYDEYKNPQIAIEKIKENPYILYQSIKGIGFDKADKIAMKLGITENDPKRINAFIQYILESNEQKGNTFMIFEELFIKVIQAIKKTNKNIIKDILNESDYFTLSGNKVALTVTYNCELEIAEHLDRLKRWVEPKEIYDDVYSENLKLIANPEYSKVEDFNVTEFIKKQEKEQVFEYNDLQKKPFYDLLKENVILITGFAGTGKSSILDGLCNMCDSLGWNIWQFALAGKASDVIAQKTGRDASTIHRGLGYNPYCGYTFDRNNPMPFKVYILDEASMVNIFLFRDWLRAIPDGSKVIIVGDTGQLEAIGAGAVLQDLIKSNLFPTIQLTQVYRQALKSGILEIATKIRNGEKFIANNAKGIHTFGEKKDCFIMCGDKTKTVSNIKKVYHSLKDKYNPDEIIILVPRKDIFCGTKNINKIIQELINPPSVDKIEFEARKDLIIRENDRVINVNNNYNVTWYNKDLEQIDGNDIYNGELGFVHGIIEIEKDKYGTYVDFGKKIILYAYDDINSIDLAYCLTVHKFQGSQEKCVIFGLDSMHQFQATRALVYTAWTRPEEMFIACLDPKVLNYAIDNNPISKKQTFLCEFIKEYLTRTK